jgi:hypothetical protein
MPDEIKSTIKDIVNAKCPYQRRVELDVVAKEFRRRCLENVRLWLAKLTTWVHSVLLL